MFPVKLSFVLIATIPPGEIEKTMRTWFPNLRWGKPDELMKDASEWPEIVMDVNPEEDSDTTEVNLLVFPRMVAGQDPLMAPTKIALMRALAREFECGVIGDTFQFAIPDTCHRSEEFLCRAGRFFQRRKPFFHQESKETWQPVDDIPAAALDSRGRLTDEEATVSAFELWRCSHWEDGKPDDANDLPSSDPASPIAMDEIGSGDPFGQPAEFVEEQTERSTTNTDEYLKRLSEWEDGFGTTPGKQLIDKGVSLPAPDSLDDDKLHEKLWQVIRGMAQANQFIHSTNHLSDRELYEYLWNRGMNETTMDLTGLSNCGYHLDLLGSGSEEDTYLTHKYFAGPQERAEWMASFPDSEMPAHEDPPYDRDRHLPKRGAPFD